MARARHSLAVESKLLSLGVACTGDSHLRFEGLQRICKLRGFD